MAKKRVTINRWDAGMQTSRIANTADEMLSGFGLVSNFDIYEDGKKLKPVPEFTRFATLEEEAIGFKGLGASGDRVYATGKAPENWYSSRWTKRVKITPDNTETPYMIFNLENMPATFWSSTGTSKLVVTRDDGVTRVAHDNIGSPDTVNQTGWIIFRKTTGSSYYYIYYNVDSEAGQELSDYQDGSFKGAYGVSDWYNFVEEDAFSDPRDYTEDSTSATYLLDDSAYAPEYYKASNFISDGLAFFDTVTTEGNVEFYNTAKNIPSYSTITVGLTFNGIGGIKETTFFYTDTGKFVVKLNSATSKIDVIFDTTGEVASTISSTTTILPNTSYRIMVTFTAGTGCYLYVNGTLEASDTTTSGNIENSSYYLIQPRNRFCLDAVFVDNTAFTSAQASSDYNQIFDNANFWAVGNEETTPTRMFASNGVCLYSKLLTDSTWREVSPTVDNIKSFDYNPIVAPILATSGDESGTIGFFADDPSSSSRTRFHISDPSLTDPVEFGYDVLSLPTYDDAIITAVRAIDNVWYFGDGAFDVDKLNGTTFSDGAFVAYPTVQSVENYNGYLAIGGKRERDYRSWVQIWDRASSASTQVVDFGNGNLRVLGNVNGYLFGVLNNYIDDSTHGAMPSMDIKFYEGGNAVKTTYSIPVTSNMDNYYSESYEQPVSQLKGNLSNKVIFYAKLPSEDGYWEGFWSVGQNKQTGTLALSLLYNTEDLGDVKNMTTIHNQVVCIHDESKVSYLNPSPTYSKESVIYTRKFNDGNGELEKILTEIQITTEPLDQNQVVTVYYRVNGETSWTEIGQMSGQNEKTKSFLKASSDNFRIWKEVEFKITSIYGSSEIKEFSFTYEDVQN